MEVGGGGYGYNGICDFPCHCRGFYPSLCHFICLMLLFRGHVTCWNFTLTEPCYRDLSTVSFR